MFHVKQSGGRTQQTAQLDDSLDPQVRERLARYLELVLRWTTTIDLIAPLPAEQAWNRHVLDSLQLAPLIPAGTASLSDLGSGGGFPGLVLAIATGLPTRLVESDHRKGAFLREAIRETGADAEVLVERAERLAPLNAPVLTARALAPLYRLFPLVQRHLAENGLAILPKGSGWRHEMDRLPPADSRRIEPTPSRTDPAAMILLYRPRSHA